MKNELENKKNEEELLFQRLERKSFVLSTIRLLSGIIAICLFIVFFQEKLYWALGFGTISLAIFLLFVREHSKISRKSRTAYIHAEIYRDLLTRYNDDWKNFKDTGNKFANDVDLFAFDLDIVGNASLYQYLCFAKTIQGKEELAHFLLDHRDVDKLLIEERQTVIKELMGNKAFLIDYITSGYMYHYDSDVDEDRINGLLHRFATNEIVFSKTEKIVSTVLAIILPIIMTASAIGILPKIALMFSVIVSMGMYLALFKRFDESFAIINPLIKSISSYQRMLDVVIQHSFEATELNSIKNELIKARKSLSKLDSILGLFYLKQNPLLYAACNLIFLYNYQCMAQLKKWQETYDQNLLDWVALIGKMEAYVSLSIPVFTKERTCFPKVIEKEDISLSIKEVIHPLMNEEEAIGNDVSLQGQCYVITGSNMAGKTTFLRSLGVNLVLMHTGSVVCCEEMTATSMEILTSMRVRDDVSTGVSTFYGELQRINKMVQFSKENRKGILLIDEIFKGTNLKDRIVGAKKTIEKLSKKNLITMLTTHDEQLTAHEIVDIKNYHFDEYYENDQIFFDYKIKDGVSTSTNARFLMKMVGILDE